MELSTADIAKAIGLSEKEITIYSKQEAPANRLGGLLLLLLGGLQVFIERIFGVVQLIDDTTLVGLELLLRVDFFTIAKEGETYAALIDGGILADGHGNEGELRIGGCHRIDNGLADIVQTISNDIGRIGCKTIGMSLGSRLLTSLGGAGCNGHNDHKNHTKFLHYFCYLKFCVQNYNKKMNLPPFGEGILLITRQKDINQCQFVSIYSLGTEIVLF